MSEQHLIRSHPMCVFITAVPITKLFARRGGGEVEDMSNGFVNMGG